MNRIIRNGNSKFVRILRGNLISFEKVEGKPWLQEKKTSLPFI